MIIAKVKRINWWLWGILILATILRLVRLGSIPPHLTPDEASLGYNAYSILKTGKDEYGKFLPIIFKSFGDYKPGLYIYATVPFVAIFGLNEFAVRFPSALAGVLSVYLIFLLVRLLFAGQRSVASMTALVAATNPWLILFSRGAWEANLSLMLTLAGIYFFLKSLRNSLFIIYASVAFGLTLLTYQGAKLASGIVIFVLVVSYWRSLVRFNWRYLVAAVGLGILISLPILVSLFTGQTGRLGVFSLFAYHDPAGYEQGLTSYLYHSQALFYLRGILTRYFNHFSGRFLFFEGDWQNLRHVIPNQGIMLISDLVLLLFGGFVLIRHRNLPAASKKFILFWLLLTPLPAALSRDQVHAVRSLNMAIPLIIIVTLGLNEVLRHKKFLIMVLSFYILALSYFLDAYFVHLPKHNSQYWYYGYKQVVQVITPIQRNFKTIKVQQSYDQPYIFFLFFQKYNPVKYQQKALLVGAGADIGRVEELDNIEFTPINWPGDGETKGTLLVGDPVWLPYGDEIKYLNGRDVAFRILAVK